MFRVRISISKRAMITRFEAQNAIEMLNHLRQISQALITLPLQSVMLLKIGVSSFFQGFVSPYLVKWQISRVFRTFLTDLRTSHSQACNETICFFSKRQLSIKSQGL